MCRPRDRIQGSFDPAPGRNRRRPPPQPVLQRGAESPTLGVLEYRLEPNYLIDLGIAVLMGEMVYLGVGYSRRYEMEYVEKRADFGYGGPADMHFPAEFRASLLAAPWQQLRLSCGLEIINWPRYMLSQKGTGEVLFPTLASGLQMELKESMQVACGLEYLFGLLPPRLALRLGARSALKPIGRVESLYDASAPPKLVVYYQGWALSGGIGVALSRLYLDAALELEKTRLAGYAKAQDIRVMLSVGWR